MKRMFRPLIIAALVGTAASAMAADTGWYVAADIGRAKDKDTQSQLDDLFINAGGATAYSSSYDDTKNSYGIAIGYGIDKNFAVEAGYINFGKHNFSATYSGGAATGDFKADGLKFSAVGILPVNDAFSVNGKIHLLYDKVDGNISATGFGGAAAASASDRSWDWGFGVGAEYKLSGQWALRGSYDMYRNVGDSNSTGESDIDVWSVGVKYSF